MAFIRNCVTTAVTVLCILVNTKAQTIFYPAGSSQLLKTTATDAAMLLQKAVAGSKFTTQAYTTMPQAGIVFIYDTTISDNQACKTKSNGIDNITLAANSDNGLHFGIYQYLQQLGFRFYQPGAAWEIIPALSSAYKKLDTAYTCSYKYKTWFVSGGYGRWIMDNTAVNDWGVYQRRNGMLGASGFAGHRGDVMNTDYINTIKNNPCYIANFNGARNANPQSVPDIFNNAAKELWANTIEQKYSQYKNAIYSNPILYADIYRNFNYAYKHVGIEVPDGSQWGNSKDNDNCNAVNYPSESDQHFTLANFTAQKILAKYPDKHFQLYAYSSHANVPSASIAINKKIDIQIIPTVYQLESSANGLRNRWYNRSPNISEYHYLNLSGWSGETPSFNWSELKATLQIAKDKKSQGLMWEASPAKFGSLPFLLAANSYLKDNIEVDSTLHEFCNNMFANASSTVFKLLQMWGQENTAPSKYKIQLYLQLVNTAVQQTQNAQEVVKERLQELKAYLHYMIMYYDLAGNDQNKSLTREDKDAALCMYIAKTNRLQLVNSYYMIAVITSRYPATSNFYTKYNTVNGTAYQNGNLPLITAAEIDNNFLQDVSNFGNKIEQFKLEEAPYIKDQFKAANIAPLGKINTFIGYTNGANYYGKTNFTIVAPAAGNFTIQYTPRFDMPGKGYINFLVESADKALQIAKDFSLDNTSNAGTLKIDLPAAGRYIFTIVSKYKSAVDLSIMTNGNYFYKQGTFLGTMVENYRADLQSLPGYFYIPNSLNKIYFHITNSFSNGKYATGDAIASTFNIKDNNNNLVQFHLASPTDSSLFYLDIPTGAGGSFWQVTKMAGYNLQFVNISNLLWYAERKACNSSNFTVAMVNKNGNCFTRVTATANAKDLSWEVNDRGRIYKYSNQSGVDLPDYISPNAVITLTNGEGCSFTKKLANDEKYLRAKEACASGAAFADPAISPVLYPNPSTGIFNCMQDGSITTADEIVIYNTQGTQVANFKNAKQFNIGNVTSGLYFYQMSINGAVYKGKVMKL
jgi:hypothetical protein